MQQPKVIFLDAMGTLFDLRQSVGEVYAMVAAEVGVTVAADVLNQTFRQSFQVANPLAFPYVDAAKIPELEFQWWRAITRSTFSQAGVLQEFADFSRFFAQLYDYFATVEPWYVYEDVLPTLNHWQSQGIELGIISNFDSRLHQVLAHLQLKDYFKSITISSLTGTAKPQPQIFQVALQKHNCHPLQAWHIGDNLEEDYYGAKEAGITAFWLERNSS
jgi:putative hydrolase of the HAD superfamily